MPSPVRLAFALATILVCAPSASAQMPIHLSANAGIAKPFGNEADAYKQGIHAGIGVKIMLFPLQFDGSFDRMAAKSSTKKDLTVLGAGVTLPINVTPGLLPVGLYLLAGGGVYHHKAETSASDFGINGGAGVRVGLPFIRFFVEARGVAVLSSVSRLTYGTLAAGIRL